MYWANAGIHWSRYKNYIEVSINCGLIFTLCWVQSESIGVSESEIMENIHISRLQDSPTVQIEDNNRRDEVNGSCYKWLFFLCCYISNFKTYCTLSIFPKFFLRCLSYTVIFSFSNHLAVLDSQEIIIFHLISNHLRLALLITLRSLVLHFNLFFLFY